MFRGNRAAWVGGEGRGVFCQTKKDRGVDETKGWRAVRSEQQGAVEASRAAIEWEKGDGSKLRIKGDWRFCCRRASSSLVRLRGQLGRTRQGLGEEGRRAVSGSDRGSSQRWGQAGFPLARFRKGGWTSLARGFCYNRVITTEKASNQQSGGRQPSRCTALTIFSQVHFAVPEMLGA
jgi:hypothetical protein